MVIILNFERANDCLIHFNTFLLVLACLYKSSEELWLSPDSVSELNVVVKLLYVIGRTLSYKLP